MLFLKAKILNQKLKSLKLQNSLNKDKLRKDSLLAPLLRFKDRKNRISNLK